MNEPAATPPKQSDFWCNFCGLTTADEQLYLAHSCAEELRRQGKTTASEGRSDHCK